MGLSDQFLDERIVAAGAAHPALPLFHCFEAIYIQRILDSMQLKPRLCNVYHEELLYLFYGKPSYKSANDNSNPGYLSPVCFMINWNAVPSIKRALAFDSGAFDRYDGFFHKSMGREEFQLNPNIDAIRKIIDFFYYSNTRYFKGQARQELPPYDQVHYQVEGYHSLITSSRESTTDDRRATIEIQLDYPIDITSDNIDAIVLPEHLDKSPTVRRILDGLSIPTLSYSDFGVASRNYYVHLLDKVQKLMIDKKLLNA
ncbi:hypothetical protein [Flaviaesturariibacter amylovorans]|uniref:DUF2971 domain-containing protein n=1 Tax=Flaviaesturariibacter amylovorans TaxID=1084520 RepID=A0ABP8H685_9BACT